MGLSNPDNVTSVVKLTDTTYTQLRLLMLSNSDSVYGTLEHSGKYEHLLKQLSVMNAEKLDIMKSL